MIFKIRGEPVAKGRPHFSKFGAYTPAKTRNAEADVRGQIIAQLPPDFKPMEKALHLDLRVCRTRPKSKKKAEFMVTKPDLDNYVKLVLDAMNTVVFKDDSQVVSIIAWKGYAKDYAGMNIYITEIASSSESDLNPVVNNASGDDLNG